MHAVSTNQIADILHFNDNTITIVYVRHNIILSLVILLWMSREYICMGAHIFMAIHNYFKFLYF